MPTGARTIVVVRKPRTDKLSVAPAAAASETTITGCVILPRQAFEEGRGWVTYEGWDIYILPTSSVQADTPRGYQDGDILSSDRIRIDGNLWQVEGPPAPYDKGTTRKATLVKVSRVGSS